MDITPIPIFPPELECVIFEIAAAISETRDRTNVLLVAKRVYHWSVLDDFCSIKQLKCSLRIRPQLYRVLRKLKIRSETLRSENHEDDIDAQYQYFHRSSARLQDVGKFVRHLMIGPFKEDHVTDILKMCPEVEDLALWTGSSDTRRNLPIIRLLPLRSLSANISQFLPEDFQGPAFSNLTHLDVILFAQDDAWGKWKVLTTLPKLTHLCLNSTVTLEVMQNLLSQCSHLRVLINLSLYGTPQSSEGYLTIEDPRLVLIDTYEVDLVPRDWEEGAYGRFDMWDFGERFVEARKRKYLRL